MTYPLTVSMTPAFLQKGDWLLRMQLNCLSKQTFKDFAVYVIDPHYNARSQYMNELADHYKLNIVHVPYHPNTLIAKKNMDCAVFNAAYCFSESPRIVRYSCWRFVKNTFTELCMNGNCDFYFHSLEAPNLDRYDEITGHDIGIWDGMSDIINWDNVPRAGQKGATWSHHSEKDAPPTLFPKNCYGNYMVLREDWLSLNGCNEAFNSTHFEDMDFTLRAHNAGITCERKALILFRMHHFYGNHSGRSNAPVDIPHKKPCEECLKASVINEPKRYDLKRRIEIGEVDVIDNIWVCKTCYLSGAVYHEDCGEYTRGIEQTGQTQAPIIPKYKIGRNLRLVVADMDGKSLTEKIDIYKNSWTDEKYYRPN